MLRKLKIKLICSYTISIGSVLTVAMTILFCWYQAQKKNQYMQQEITSFELQLRHVRYLYQTSNMLKASEYQEIELQNNQILYFEENGKKLRFQGFYQSKSNRDVLIEKMKKEVQKESIDMSVYPKTYRDVESSVHIICGEYSEKYLGKVIMIPMNSTYRSIIALQEYTPIARNGWKEIFLFVMIDVLTVFVVFLVSRIFVKKTLKPVEESQKKQDIFIASASHELKTPIAVIQSCAEAILCDHEETDRFTRNIQSECKRMAHLVEELLLYASFRANRWKITKETFDLDNFLIESYEKLLFLFEKKKQELQLILPQDENHEVQADQQRLYQVLNILCDNASKYAPDHSIIELILTTTKREYQILVKDHGIGIPDNQKQHVFEKFYQIDSSHTRKNSYGLGLSIAKEILKQMQASITIEDTQGGGATFIIHLNAQNS